MKKFFTLFVILLMATSYGSLNLEDQQPLPSFGYIKYRAPKNTTRSGEAVVLVHGIYAGSTSSTWKELLPLLDAEGLETYVIDLPGAGLNGDITKKVYNMDKIDSLIREFLIHVVRRPATLIGESLTTTNILKVAGDRPDLVKKLVLLSPTGINSLAMRAPAQGGLFQQFWNDDSFANFFYTSVFTDENLRFFLEKTVYDDSLITEDRIRETQEGGKTDQKWLTLSFVGGHLVRPFSTAVQNVTSPTLMIFGEEAESSGSTDDLLEVPSEFKRIRPDFELKEVPLCGQSVHREKPVVTKNLILDFLKK